MAEGAEILIVEDNPADQMLTLEALKDAPWAGPTHVVETGNEAMEYLHGKGPRPDLIILDLNLPGEHSGPDVLSEVRRRPELRDIPVVVLTSSETGRDVSESYARGADCYVRKPYRLEDLSQVTRRIEDCWMASRAAAHWSLAKQIRLGFDQLRQKAQEEQEKASLYWLLLVMLLILIAILI